MPLPLSTAWQLDNDLLANEEALQIFPYSVALKEDTYELKEDGKDLAPELATSFNISYVNYV